MFVRACSSSSGGRLSDHEAPLAGCQPSRFLGDMPSGNAGLAKDLILTVPCTTLLCTPPLLYWFAPSDVLKSGAPDQRKRT
jgi:hypothetical protein